MGQLRTQTGALIKACHPEPTIAVTTVITALAISAGQGPTGVLAVAAAVLAGQLSIGWSNDWIDADRDQRSRRTDKPAATGAVSPATVRTAALVSAALCVPLSFLSGLTAGVVHLVAVACGWAYNAGLKSTVFSAVPYAVAFGCLPAFVVLGLPGSVDVPVWLVAAGALLGTSAHFANVIPDLADDASTGVRGLPHRLGRLGSSLAAGVLLLGASWMLSFAHPEAFVAVAAAMVILGVGFWFGRRPGSRAPFRAVLVVAVLDIVLLLVANASL